MNKKWVFIVVFTAFLSQCKNSAPHDKAKQAADQAAAVEKKVILSVGFTSLTNRDLKNFIQLQYADAFSQKDNDKLLSRLFDVFCEQRIILFKAEQAGVQVSESEVADYLKEIRSRRQDLNVDAPTIRDVLKVQKYLLASAYKNVAVSDAQVAQFYESHLSDFRRSEEIRLFQIMVKDREQLLKIRQELLNQPSRFEEVARSESISPEAANGGAMGLFEKGMLPQEMEGVVFSLKVNEISPIVESPYGFHLFKITQKRKARMLLLDAVKDEIKSRMLSARLADAYQDFLAELKIEISLQVHYDNLYFSYIKSDSGVSQNEAKNFSDDDPGPGN
ncbi:MAG: peptidylprolyl isomerase [Candidatus Aminicenantes bacterium]|nr:peptidylprolyl isomerase [Candidatus Aminicenantes bacterium]